jgi:hypothetical protein
MKHVLKEVLGTFFSYCNMAAMIGHSKVVTQHYNYFDVTCGRKVEAKKIDWSLVLESESILLKQNNVEDKVVVLCLLQETIKYFSKCGHTAEDLSGMMKWAFKRETLVKLFKVATGHGTTPTSRGKSEWMASKATLEDRPYSCLANAFTVLLHFELIADPNEVLISSALAVLKELQPFVSMENNVERKGNAKGSTHRSTAHELIVQELLLASLLADANLPTRLPLVLSCMFEYLKQDARTVNAKLSLLFSGRPEAEDSKEREELDMGPFFYLMSTFYKPYFSLRSKCYARTKASIMSPEEDMFFQALFTIIELLLQVVDLPAEEVLWNSESERSKALVLEQQRGMDKGKIKAVLGMSQPCLEILQIIFVECGLDLEACSSDKLKWRVERSSMALDYILSKLLHAITVFESSGKGVDVLDRECLDVYHGVKRFVATSLETFSLEAVQKRQQEKAENESAKNQVETSRQQQQNKHHQPPPPPAAEGRDDAKAKPVKRTRRKTAKRSRNAYINAALQGEGYYKEFDGDELDDLEDFIVCKPGRNYDQVLAKRAPLRRIKKNASKQAAPQPE